MSATTSVNIAIPHLKKNQSIEDWRRGFTASVALIEDKQALRLLPTYVCRSTGDQLLAEVASKETTLDKALDQLQILIDGEISEYTWMRRFCDAKLEVSSTAGQTAFFFELMKIAKNAGLTPQKGVLRFLNNIPMGETIYSKIRYEVGDELDDTKLLVLFKKIQPMLKQTRDISSLSQCQYKANTEETDTFHAQSTGGALAELHNKLDHLQQRFDQEFGEDEQSEISEISEISQDTFFGQKKMKKTYKCTICNKTGHDNKLCWKRICEKCSGRGHDKESCASKTYHKGKTL
jgi:hypothetical protein